MDKRMGAPGLAFETWDPPRKCRKTKLENSNFEKAVDTDTTRSNSPAHSKARWNVRENSVPPAFAWRIPGLKSETWGTHPLIQEVQCREKKLEMSVCAGGKRRLTIVGAGTKKNFPSREELRSSERHFSNSQLYAG